MVLLDSSDVSNIFAGGEEPYVVDERAGTLRPLDVPEEVDSWGPNVDEYLWGGGNDCKVLWATNGAFDERRLDCPDGAFVGAIYADEFSPGWLRPGRMALLEESTDPGEDQDFLHVSLDRGVTWQRIPLGEDEALADVLPRLD